MDEDAPIWVSVLLDWQNIYRCAREAFGLDGERAVAGTVDPLRLARELVASGSTADQPRKLQEVRVYRGRPDNTKDPKGYSAWRSQTAAWQASMGDLLIPRYRDLRYRRGAEGVEKGVEKGVDVWLAVDLVKIAMDRGAHRAIVMTSDTDLVPAVELAVEVRGTDFVEVAGWEGQHQSAAILVVAGARRHRLDFRAFQRVSDATDYGVNARARRRQGWDAQIAAEGKRRRDNRPAQHD
ncbi:MAG: NYN domain-containing protein [Actinomycetota bacterium]|nr:NYN domain-containing protein [Actinomycetota bacterium]